MHLTWFGHSTWRVEHGDTTLLIDPFFDNPKTDADPGDLDPDTLLLTHGHDDHVADVDVFRDATLAGTPEVLGYLAEEHGFDEDDLVGFNLGGTVELGDVFVTMHRADHTNGLEDGFNVPGGGSPVGYVVSDARPTARSDGDTTAFYHAGDTALMTEMREVVGPYLDPDAAAVPIGDHFTMGPMQAAVAVDWLGVNYTFPMHYDTFPPIEQDPEAFREEVSAVGCDAEVVVPEAGERFELSEPS